MIGEIIKNNSPSSNINMGDEAMFSKGHALVIGVDTYTYVPRLDVPVAANDASALVKVLTDAKYCGYPKEKVHEVSGVDATKDGINTALDQLAKQVGPEDTVFLFHCCHGDYGTDGSFYLICNDTKIDGNKVVAGSGLCQDELLRKIKAIPARRMLMVFNSCHSGELSPSLGGDQPLGEKNLPGNMADALLSTGDGRVVITACRESQRSWIGRGALSIFTQTLVDILKGNGVSPKGGFISLFDLYPVLYEEVDQKAMKQVGQRQEPGLTILKGVGPFAMALYQGAHETDLGGLEKSSEQPQGPAVRQVEPEHSQNCYQQIIRQNGGINFGQASQVNINGDVIGGDKVDVQNSPGFLHQIRGTVQQDFGTHVNTGGGAYIGGSVTVQGGNFIGRDQINHAQSRSQPKEREEFHLLLEQLRLQLKEAQLDAKLERLAKCEIDQMEEEVHDEKPSLSVIEAKLSSIRSIIQKVAGASAAGISLVQILQRAAQLAQALFK